MDADEGMEYQIVLNIHAEVNFVILKLNVTTQSNNSLGWM